MPPFAARRATSAEEIAESRKIIDLYTQPGPIEASLAAVATMLSFKRNVQRDQPTDDDAAAFWRHSLEPFPAWAVIEACMWWLSAANPQRQYPPVPGDIEARALELMAPLRAAIITCERGPAPPPKPETPRVPASAEARARILAEAGYRVPPVIKRFGGEDVDEPSVAKTPDPSRASRTPPPVESARTGGAPTATGLVPSVDEALRRARDANPLIKAARADQAKKKDSG